MDEEEIEGASLLLHFIAAFGHSLEIAGVSIGMLALAILAIEELEEVYSHRRGLTLIKRLPHLKRKKHGTTHL